MFANQDQVWYSNVCKPKTKCETLMCLNPKPNVILWFVTPFSIQNLDSKWYNHFDMMASNSFSAKKREINGKQ